MADITGTANPDFLTGTTEDDLIDGLASDDLIYGFDGDDSLLGAAGDDILYGGSGNDTLDGGAGADMFYGQSGLDTVSYASALAGVFLHLTDSRRSTGDARGDYFLSVENAVLTAFDDICVADDVANRITGGQGDDLILGLSGNDTLFGGAGDDTLEGGAGGDLIDGGEGFDWATYAFASGQVSINLLDPALGGGDGRQDSLIGIEALELSNYSDRVQLSQTLLLVLGKGGNDTLIGFTGPDTLLGGFGADVLAGGSGHDRILGENGNDRLEGGEGDDTLLGGSGNDTMMGQLGADLLDGGDGFDSVVYMGPLTLDLTAPANSTGDAAGDTLIGIERLEFGGEGDVTYVGGIADMFVIAEGTAVTAIAGSGVERFVVNSGSMAVSYATTTAAVTFDAVGGRLTGFGGAQGDRLIGVSSLTLSGFDDVYEVDRFTNKGQTPTTIHAGDGHDRLLLGQTQPSIIDTGNGHDTVAGVMADGSLVLGGGNDKVSLALRGSGVGGPALVVQAGEGADNISIGTAQGRLTVLGEQGNDRIVLSDVFNQGQYTVDGGEGNDTITTRSGRASVLGGQGDDRLTITAVTTLDLLSGGEGNDVIVVRARAGTAQGDAGNDTLTFQVFVTGTGNAVLEGGAGDDTLTILGNFSFGDIRPGNRALFDGGDGNDLLNDSTAAAFVASTFVFRTGWGNDTVTGFDDGVDRVRFDSIAGLEDFADLTLGGDATRTLITFGSDTILLEGLDVALFSAADVVFA